MLEYKVSIASNNSCNPIKLLSIDVSNDLSVLSGVTYASEHIETLQTLSITNKTISRVINCDFTCENHQRMGFIYVNGDSYDVLTANTIAHPVIGNREGEWKYIEFQNSCYYVVKDADTNEEYVNIPYIVNSCGEIETGNTRFVVTDGKVKISYGIWVDDNTISFHGAYYLIDAEYTDDTHAFALKTNETSNPLFASDLEVDDLVLTLFENKYRYDVTYFWANCNVEEDYSFDNISCGNHVLFLNYNGIIRKCVNIQTKETPLWAVLNINDDLQNPISAICYTTDASGEEIALSGETFKDYDIEDLVREHNDFWIYVSGDTTNTKFPLNVELQNSNFGEFLLVDANDGSMMGVGTQFRFSSVNTVQQLPLTYGQDATKDYVLYNGKAHYRELGICNQLEINGEYFDITYEDETQISGDTIAHVNIYGIIVDMHTISNGTKLEKRNTQIVSGDELVYPQYNIIKRDGVKIKGVNYPIIDVDTDEMENGVNETGYVQLSIKKDYDFEVIDTYGSNIMIMSPILSLINFNKYELNVIKKQICNDIINNPTEYASYYLCHLFGNKPYETGLGYIDEYTPSSTRAYYDLESSIVIYGRGSYMSLNVPLQIKPANNILLDNIQYNEFYESNKKKLINSYVDMEKDVYYPMCPKIENGKYVFSKGFPVMLPVFDIEVNLHFRTRNTTNWKVIESYDDPNNCNWFITDYKPYSDLLTNRPEELIEASDLMGFLNFTNNDIFYQKKKVEKSFLRFSVYDSTDMQTQTLLHTATVWMDETYAYKKYISNTKRLDSLIFKQVSDSTVDTVYTGHSISVFNEPFQNNKYTLNDENRISSRFSIKNKYESNGSSEGFYMYIFKEYTQSLKPVPLYLKVEFNHAGIGQTIPFIVPMAWANKNGICYPVRKLELNQQDLTQLKRGYALEDIYMQTYIPLYCAYDKINHQYFYYFDDRYATNDNGVVKLNLFEIKVADSDAKSVKETTLYNLSDDSVTNNLLGNIS